MKLKIRDQRNGNWYWISRLIYQQYAKRIGVIGLAIYNAYASYAFQQQEVFPSQNTIVKKLGITKPTLIKYNKVLVKYKLIKIYKEDGKPNHVSLLDIRDLPVKEVYQGGKGGLPPGVKEVYPKNNKLKRINKKDVRKQVSDRSFRNETTKKSFYSKCTIKLIKLLQKKYKIRIPNKKKWTDQFELLNTKDGVKKKEIKKVLKWYCQHIGEFRVPNPLCAESFRLKFDNMKAAIRRSEEQIEKGEQKITCRKIKRKKK